MNLNDFEDYFDTTILKRGKNYYHDGAVLSIEKSLKMSILLMLRAANFMKLLLK